MSLSQKPYREGVGMMVLNPQNQVLVGRRIDNDTEAWQMPQGGIDRGETPTQAAFRELREEIGTDKVEIISETNEWLYYNLPEPIASKLWNGRYAGQMQKWFLMRFIGNDSDININTHHPEFAEWTWESITNLPNLIVEFKKELYNKVISEFSSHFNLPS